MKRWKQSESQADREVVPRHWLGQVFFGDCGLGLVKRFKGRAQPFLAGLAIRATLLIYSLRFSLLSRRAS